MSARGLLYESVKPGRRTQGAIKPHLEPKSARSKGHIDTKDLDSWYRFYPGCIVSCARPNESERTLEPDDGSQKPHSRDGTFGAGFDSTRGLAPEWRDRTDSIG